MKKQPKDSAIGRREFLAATGGLLAAAVPGGETIAHAANSEASLLGFPAAKASGNLRKIPIGVFYPGYDHLSLNDYLDNDLTLRPRTLAKSTRGYTSNPHYPLDGHIPPRS